MLAIATTASAKNREFILRNLGLSPDIFSVILGDEDVSHGKPNPEIYLKAAKNLHKEPNSCLVFEDSPPGVTSGKNAGMTVVAILSSHTEVDLENADYFIQDYTEATFI